MKNTKAGFSLVEAILTIILIAIAAVVALPYLVYCSHFALQTDARMAAANLARGTVEGLYKRAYNDAGLNPTTGTPDSLAGTVFLSRYPTAARNYTISDKGDYKLITATVTWDQ
jgi:type II secretory pathway pseudopilin PulG